MSLVADLPRMTMEEFLALPDDDGVSRDLIEGRLWEDDSRVTRRNKWHSGVESETVGVLLEWLKAHPHLGGRIHSGEAGFVLADGTGVGVDVAYVSAAVIAASIGDDTFFAGAPVLAVEILSPSDRYGRIVEKIRALLNAGCLAVWSVDPYLRTISIYRPEHKPVMVNDGQDLSGEDYLPGLLVPAARIFGP